MIDPGDHSNDETDVGVFSLGDRRRIRELEVQVEDLGRRLAETSGQLHPGLTKKLANECCHRGRFEVADLLLEVRCIECDALMDPYVVLRKIAHREVNFCYTLNALRLEKETLSKDVERMKAQRSSLRSQLKRRGITP